MAQHVRKGDTVAVITGADRGKVGEGLRGDAAAGKGLVQGVKMAYRHLRPSRRHPQGGRIQKEMPLNISNVLPVDPKTNQPTRVGFRINPDGSKERIAKKSGEVLGTIRAGKEQR